MATKFTRWNFGLGAGYAILSNPQFEYSNGETAENSYLSSIDNYAKSSVNHIKYAKSSPFFQYFTTLELGAVVLSYEQTFYFNAMPASTPNVSVAYLFPLKRAKQ